MSTNGFDMEGVEAALKDVTKVSNNTPPAKNEEAHNLAREKGWVEPQEFDYDAYNATGKAAAAREVGQSEWAHSAEKYEWKEEYGDVGPPSAALEAQLFQSNFINRRGIKFDK
jgi:ATP-dependent RNA helicase DDX3X